MPVLIPPVCWWKNNIIKVTRRLTYICTKKFLHCETYRLVHAHHPLPCNVLVLFLCAMYHVPLCMLIMSALQCIYFRTTCVHKYAKSVSWYSPVPLCMLIMPPFNVSMFVLCAHTRIIHHLLAPVPLCMLSMLVLQCAHVRTVCT